MMIIQYNLYTIFENNKRNNLKKIIKEEEEKIF